MSAKKIHSLAKALNSTILMLCLSSLSLCEGLEPDRKGVYGYVCKNRSEITSMKKEARE